MNKLLMKMKNIFKVEINYKKKFIQINSENITYAKIVNEQTSEFHKKVVKLLKFIYYLNPNVELIVVKE